MANHATIDQIAHLGHPEKNAARAYTEEGSLWVHGMHRPAAPSREAEARSRERMAFLQGIHWERERWLSAMAAQLTALRLVDAGQQVETSQGRDLGKTAEDMQRWLLGRLCVQDSASRCPHGYRLEELRDGTASCSSGCR